MTKTIAILAILFITCTTSFAQVAAHLAGTYQMDVPGGDRLELRSNGTAAIAGEETAWSVQGDLITIGPDVMRYTLKGDRLVLTMGSIQIPWKRIAGAGKSPSSTKKTGTETRSPQQDISGGGRPKVSRQSAVGPKASTTAAHSSAQDEQVKQVLTGSAWCSFTYNKVSGTSTTRKVIFRPDGVMMINGGSETYSSGYGGTYAGQSNSAGAMKWRVENLRLFLDQGDGSGFQDIGLNATKNSNGSVILHAGGQEYSMCN